MCSSCAYDDAYEELRTLREKIDRLDANAAGLTKKELVKQIEQIAEEIWE